MDIEYAPPNVIAAVKDYEASRVSPQLEFLIDGNDYTEALDKQDWGWGDGFAILLKATLEGRIVDDLQGAPVEMSYYVDGFHMEQVSSAEMRMEHPSKTFTTEMLATTAGGAASRYFLEEDMELLGYLPEQVLRTGAFLLPYDRSQIRIHDFKRPKLNRRKPTKVDPENTAFLQGQEVKAIFDSVEAEVSYLAYDTSRGLHIEKPTGFGVDSAPTWSYRRNGKEIIDWPKPTRVDPDEEYAWVAVQDRNEDGSMRIDQWHPVNHTGERFPPDDAQTLYLPFTDTSTTATELASIQAFMEAEALGRGEHYGKAVVVWNPFIMPGKVLRFEEEYRDDAGLWHRLWSCVVEKNILHEDVGRRMRTNFDYRAVKLEDDLIKAPSLVLLGMTPAHPGSYILNAKLGVPPPAPLQLLSGGAVLYQIGQGAYQYGPLSRSSGGAAAFAGAEGGTFILAADRGYSTVFSNDSSGFYYDDTTGTTWVGNDAEGWWVDPDVAVGAVYSDSQGFGLEILDEFFNDIHGFGYEDENVTGYVGNDAGGWWIDPELSDGKFGSDSGGFWIDE